jgi:hypothetical protein
VDGSCISSSTFSGCSERRPCASPRDKAAGCIYELQGCETIDAGSTSSLEVLGMLRLKDTNFTGMFGLSKASESGWDPKNPWRMDGMWMDVGEWMS